MKTRLSLIYRAIRAYFLRRGAQSKLFGFLYYALFSRAFLREQRAVLYGCWKHSVDAQVPQRNRYRLIRNIHRLEKGLLMTPQREIFGRAYIAETLRCYQNGLLGVDGGQAWEESDLLKWAHDVLSMYFGRLAPDAETEKLRRRFEMLPSPSAEDQATRTPWRHDLSEPPSVSYHDLHQIAERRKSFRWYLPIPVPRRLIDDAIALASLAPSACNRQPYCFRVFDDPELVQRIASVPMGTKGYSHNIPVIVALVGELRAFFDERDRHLIYIDTALASMLFILALETQGLGSCCINWPDIAEKEDEIAEIMNLEPDQRLIMLIALGYPDPEGLVAYSQRASLDRLRRYNLP